MAFDMLAVFANVDEATLGALVETMALAADADGSFGSAEQLAIANQLRDLFVGTPVEALVANDSVSGMLTMAAEALKRDGRVVRLASVKNSLGDTAFRKGALVLAIRVVAMDGVIRTSERELLLDLAEALELDPDEAADLVREFSVPPTSSPLNDDRSVSG